MRIPNYLLALVAVSFAVLMLPAQAQRLSLAERVAKLEQQQSQGDAQGNIQLVNQINALQSQLQTLQGQIEELRHQLDEQKSHSKDQYIDLDSRVGRLEGHAPAATPDAGGGAANAGAPAMQDVQLGSPQVAQTPPPPAAPNEPQDMPGAAQQGQAAAPQDPKIAYDSAFGALKDGRYAESARLFQAFIAQFPNDELTPNAYYWLGESYYVTQNYPVSLDTFQKLLAQFPNSQKAPDALLKVGYCQYEMKQWDQAQATLSQVLQKYPNTTVANLAQGRLRALKIEAQH